MATPVGGKLVPSSCTLYTQRRRRANSPVRYMMPLPEQDVVTTPTPETGVFPVKNKTCWNRVSGEA